MGWELLLEDSSFDTCDCICIVICLLFFLFMRVDGGLGFLPNDMQEQ